jgi:hypothetical protein
VPTRKMDGTTASPRKPIDRARLKSSSLHVLSQPPIFRRDELPAFT